MSEFGELRDEAIEAARRAGGEIARRYRLREMTVSAKDALGVDLVTDADRASEAIILEHLRRRFPGHTVLAEESGETTGGAVRWYVDPLDGTVNYAHRVPHFSVSIAVEVPPHGVVAGVVLDPLRDELFAAARGEGATLDGQPVHVSGATTLGSALLATGFPYDFRSTAGDILGLFNRVGPRAQGVRRLGSAALDLAYVAAGRFDVYYETGLKPWDTAAGAVLVQEAGGLVVTFSGAPFVPQAAEIIAGTVPVTRELLAEVSAAWASRG